MGRPSNTEARRAQIVDGLLSAMAERGYEGATIVAIAKKAGLRSGLVHYHFDSKQAILVALVQRLVAAANDRFERRLTLSSDAPAARLDAWIDAQLDLGQDGQPEVLRAWVFVGAEAIRQPEVRAVYERAIKARFEQARELLRPMLDSTRGAEETLNELTALLMSMIEGAYQLGSTTTGLLPKGFAAGQVKRAMHALVAAEPSPDGR